MFKAYKNRMAYRGKNMSEMLRMQSNMVIEQTWDRDPNYRQVYVVKVDSGLPKVTAEHELIDVKFNVKSYQTITSDEVSYLLQFRHGAEHAYPEIDIGSYVYMSDEDHNWKWWLIVHLDERPQFRQYQILECNWTLRWISEGRIYNCLGVQRVQQSYNSGSWDADRTTAVDNVTSIWLPTNTDTLTLDYNKRFIISDPRKYPPIVYQVSKWEDTQPIGLIKLKMTQETFDPKHDNAELMLCNYYNTKLPPVESVDTPEHKMFDITYNGTKPAVKVGGSEKVFTAQLPDNNYFDVKWIVSDGINAYCEDTYDNYSIVFGDYTITTEDRIMRLKVARNYSLVNTILTIKALCADGSEGEVKVEVIG
jgi:hypothetical protein